MSGTNSHHAERGAADENLSLQYLESDRTIPRAVLRPVRSFLQTEVASGAVLVAAAVVALIWANSPWHTSYERLWHTELGFELGRWALRYELHHWVNDGLMAIFFAVVGLEIKRELVHGQLRDRRAAMLPVVAALSGMVVPATIYAVINVGAPGARGWGIPMATDIAFAVGVLVLAGRRLPPELKIFLLSIAVADDIGAIIVIAIFYSSGVTFGWLAAAIGLLALNVVFSRLGVRHLGIYLAVAVAAWFALLESGVHATLAGVATGLLTPAHAFHARAAAARAIARRVGDVEGNHASAASGDQEHDEGVLWEVRNIAREATSPLFRVEHSLLFWSAFVILPIFALANAGVRISSEGLSGEGASLVAIGVALGLLVGKPLGIVGATVLATKLGIGRLPAGVTLVHVVGAGIVAGVGFTVALFVAGLAFADPVLTEAAKIGILGGSLLAAVIGYLVLRLAPASASAAVTPAREPVEA